jgi:hypothetical protein
MAYIECQTALISTLQALTTNFAEARQVVTSNETILDDGVMTAAILMPGPVGLVSVKANYVRTWGIILDLYHAWRGDLLSSLVPFETLRAAVILAIDNNPNLVVSGAGVNGVYNVEIVSDGDPGPYTKSRGVDFIAQRFRVTVYQYLRAS